MSGRTVADVVIFAAFGYVYVLVRGWVLGWKGGGGLSFRFLSASTFFLVSLLSRSRYSLLLDVRSRIKGGSFLLLRDPCAFRRRKDWAQVKSSVATRPFFSSDATVQPSSGNFEEPLFIYIVLLMAAAFSVDLGLWKVSPFLTSRFLFLLLVRVSSCAIRAMNRIDALID